MLLLALVFLPQLWSLNCTENSASNNCALRLLVDDASISYCDPCNEVQCCVVDPDGPWAIGFYAEAYTKPYVNEESCVENYGFVPFKTRIPNFVQNPLQFSAAFMNNQMTSVSPFGEFRGYVEWQTSLFESDTVSATCSCQFEFQLGSPLTNFPLGYVRVPFVIKYENYGGQFDCKIFVNGTEALASKDTTMRLWAFKRDSWIDSNSTDEIAEVGQELTRIFCDAGADRCPQLTSHNFLGDPFTVCELDFVQCLSLGSPLALEDVAWAFHPRGQLAGNKRAVDMVLGRITHVALMLQMEPLTPNLSNFSAMPPALALLAVYTQANSSTRVSVVVPTTLQAFVGTASSISVDSNSGNLTQLSYFSGPFDVSTILVQMPMAVTVQLFPSGWNIADTWISQPPLHHNALCSYQAAQTAKQPRTDGAVSTTCNGQLPTTPFYCMQGLWDSLETMVITGIPVSLASFIVRAPRLRSLVVDSSMADTIDFRVDPTEVLQLSNNPRLKLVTFKGATHRATSVNVYGNTVLSAFNVNNSLQAFDLSFSNTTLVSSFDTKNFPNLLSYTCVMCSLPALPPSIDTRMPGLKYLNLSTNRIQLQLNTFVKSAQWKQMQTKLCRLGLDFNMIGGPFPGNFTDLMIAGCATGEESQLDFAFNLIESFQSPGEFVDGANARNWTLQFVPLPDELSRELCTNPIGVSANTKIPWLALRGNRLKGSLMCNSSLVDTYSNDVWLNGTMHSTVLSTWTSFLGRNSTKSMFFPYAVSWLESTTIYAKVFCEMGGDYNVEISGFDQRSGTENQLQQNNEEGSQLMVFQLGFNAPMPSRGEKLYDDNGYIWAQRQQGWFSCSFPSGINFDIWTTKSCSLGRGLLNGGTCELCPLNTWSEWCGNCVTPTMYMPEGFRHKQCSACPANVDAPGTAFAKTISTVTKQDATVNLEECVCPFASYGFPAKLQGSTPTSNCHDCRDFAVCSQINETRPKPRDGYYYNLSSNLFMACDPAKACQGGICATGYSPTPGGSPCSKCGDGFYRVNRECRECFSAAPFLLGVLAVFLVIALFYLLRISKTDSTKLFAISISLGYIQIISIFAAFPVSWPQTTQDMLNFLSFFNFNFDLASPECAVKTTFWNKWLMKLMLPLIAGGIMWIWYLIIRCSPRLQAKWIRFVTRKPGLDRCMLRLMVGSSARKLVHQRQLIAREQNPADDRELAMEWEKGHLKNRFICSAMTLATLGYTFMAKTSTQPFNCLQTIYETLPHLRADPSISCYDTTWYSWLPVAVFFNLLYTAGIPLTFLVILLRGYRKKKLQDPDFLSNFGNLVLPFREQYWFWELIQLSRKLITVLLIDFKADNSDTTTFGQINGVLLVLVLFFILQQFIRPYEFTWCNRLEFTWTGMTLLILMAALIFSFDILNAAQLNAYSVFLILSLCIALAVTLYTLFLEKRRVLVRVGLGNNAFHKIETDHQMLDEVFGEDLGDSIYRQTRGMSPELREQFFSKVSGLTPMSSPSLPSTMMTSPSVELSTKLLKKGDGSSGGNPAAFPNLL